MRIKSNFSVWFLSALMMLGIGLSTNSCKPEGLTDNSEFSLYYPGISDIGPSTAISVTPTWHGKQPSNFEIYQVTLDGNIFTEGGDAFQIDTETGVVSLSNTDNLPVGKYLLSISCNSNGKLFKFADAIRVNMLRPVPEGIVVDPSHIDIKLEDIINNENLTKAKIITEGEHISIKSYLFGNVRRDGNLVTNPNDFFKLSKDGEFSIIPGNKDFIPGFYEFDFKLTTMIVGEDSQEGIYEKALTVDVTSAPLELKYEPSEGKVEAGYAYESPIPSFIGSLKGLKFLLKSVEPACADLQLNEENGQITFAQGNNLKVGDKFHVSITAQNDCGTKDFENVYAFEVVSFIQPIEKLVYGNINEVVQTCSFENKVTEVVGDDIVYSLKNLPKELEGLEIDAATGTVSAPKHNEFPVGKHTITVVAKNSKGEKETTFTINIVKNPYMFTFVSWGNNLDLKPAKQFASQHRIEKGETLTLPIAESDLPEGQFIKFELDPVHMKTSGLISIDEKGTITVKFDNARHVNASIITIIVGEGEAAVTRKIPVFFNNIFIAKGAENYIEYKPFALCINPLKGGKGNPALVYDKDRKEVGTANFSIDFRRTFNFYNINGPKSHKNGQPKDGGFLYDVWDQYYNTIGKPINTGSRDPMSYYSNKSDLTKAACYLKAEDGSLVVNPNKFVDKEGIPANGIVTGQAPFLMKANTDPGKGTQIFPIAIWFDTKF